MEPSRRSTMGGGNNAATATNVAAPAAAGLLLSPSSRPSAAVAAAAIATNAKSPGLGHGGSHRALSQHCNSSGSNVIQHHQYAPILVGAPPPLIRSSLVHPTGSLLSTSPQLMLSTTTASASEVIPRYQQHVGEPSHQLAAAGTTPPVSVGPIVMQSSNISAVGMALSPFGILPHERVVPHQTHHRHQNRKLAACSPQSSKTHMETGSSVSGAQVLASPVTNLQRFYAEPLAHGGNKMKQYDSVQQQHHRNKIANGVSDKNQPVVSSGYTTQSYEPRYQPRTASQQVGYLSVITRTAVTTANGAVMDDVTTGNSYYQAQPLPLQSKTPDNHDRQYYHFDSTVSTSQTPQQQVDNMLLMGTPIQRGDPMHIVKNLQSMQTDIDCYGVKKMIEQPRLLNIEGSKSVGPTPLLNNSSKCLIENQQQHLQQLPKSSVSVDLSSSYNSQYFNRRQPPPAHLHQHHNQSHIQQHLVAGNSKMFPTPTSLTVVSANGNAYLDQRHHCWSMDQQKPPTISTPSCFSGNISTGMFHQPTLQQQQYNNTASTFNVQPPASSIHQHQHMTEPGHHNNFIASSRNPTYYSPTTTMVSPTVTSVTTTSPSMSLYNRQNNSTQQNPNNFHNFTNNVQGGNFVLNNENRSQALPHVVVPNIEQELGHLCDDPSSTTSVIVKPTNVITKKPSFIDSYIKFLHGDANSSTVETNDEYHDKPKKLSRSLLSLPSKPISKPYIPLSKPKTTPVSVNEQTSSRNGSCEDIKKVSNSVSTIDDDPRYFPLPKTSASVAGISDDKSNGSNDDNNWLSSTDDDQDQWWTSSSKASGVSSASVIKNKLNTVNKKKKNDCTVKKKETNSVTAIKKQKIQHEQQPRRQLSHRLAKEKTQKLLNSIKSDADDEDILSDADSDVDPAWIPNDDNDTSKNSNVFSNRRHFNHKKFSKEQCSNSGHNPSTSSSINNNCYNNQIDDSTITMPFKSGSFVALKSQFLDKNNKTLQQLWRVDGKSLLQKFQRCDEDNIFKSVTTYTGWGPSHYNMYRQVAVEFITPQNDTNVIPHKSSTIDILVKLLTDDKNSVENKSEKNSTVSPTDDNNTSKSKVDVFNSNIGVSVDDPSMSNLRSDFDVYIQTLASQVLDSNFLGEIYRENDDYFLSSVGAIETVTHSCLQAIDSVIAQESVTNLSNVDNVHTVIIKYPNLEMYSMEEIAVGNLQLYCVVCGRQGIAEKQQKFIEITLSGSEYNAKTLKNVEIDKTFSKTEPVKRVYCCSNTQCTEKLIIVHSLKHLKYHIYMECCKRVTVENDNTRNENTNDTTSVLNRLLADDEWIKKLFQMVCSTWSRAKMFISNRQSNCRVPS